MTESEKKSTWDGVFRRASEFPDGVSPFVNKPSNWDGVDRRGVSGASSEDKPLDTTDTTDPPL